DRRISGSAASLVGLGSALRRLDTAVDEEGFEEAAQAADVAVARLLLGYAVVYGWGGIPVVWSGDEVAQLNDEHWDEVPEHDGDNRWAHRPRLDWDCVQEARQDAGSAVGRVWAGMQHLARVRASLPHLHASWPAETVAAPDPGVFVVLRRHPVGPMLQLYNVTEQPRTVPAWWVREQAINLDGAVDALNGFPPNLTDDGSVYLSTYQPVWLVRR